MQWQSVLTRVIARTVDEVREPHWVGCSVGVLVRIIGHQCALLKVVYGEMSRFTRNAVVMVWNGGGNIPDGIMRIVYSTISFGRNIWRLDCGKCALGEPWTRDWLYNVWFSHGRLCSRIRRPLLNVITVLWPTKCLTFTKACNLHFYNLHTLGSLRLFLCEFFSWLKFISISSMSDFLSCLRCVFLWTPHDVSLGWTVENMG